MKITYIKEGGTQVPTIVGDVFNAKFADWVQPSGSVLTEIENGFNFYSTDNNTTHKVLLSGYGGTMLSDVKLTWRMKFYGTPLSYKVGIDSPRVFIASPSSIQSGGSSADSVVSGSVSSLSSVYYDMELTLKNNVFTHTIKYGNETKTVSLSVSMSVNEHNEGLFYISFASANTDVTDFKISYTSETNCNVLLGDSVSWGRNADSFITTWWSKIMKGQKASISAHGNAGFDMWIDSMHEIKKLQPRYVWLMGSYVDVVAPGTLATFQAKYTQIVDFIKTIQSVVRINHLASFPSVTLPDIRPFNNWKKETFNTGIDRYIDDYYNTLEVNGGTGTRLKPIYDSGGSHLTQEAQDIVADSILKHVENDEILTFTGYSTFVYPTFNNELINHEIRTIYSDSISTIVFKG